MTEKTASSQVVESNSSSTKGFSPVGDLLHQAWETVTQSWKNILLLYIILYAVVFVGILIIAGTWAGSLALSAGAGMHLGGASAFAVLITVVVGLALAVGGTALGVALMLAVAEAGAKPSVGSLISRGFKLFIPVFLTSLLVAFLVYGGAVLFLIGGVIIAIFTCFATYEVVFTENRYGAAISNSVRMVAQNFGEVFVRFLVIIGLTIGLWIVEGILQNMVGDGSARGLLGLIMMVVQALFGWFILAYSYLVYKEARAATDFKKITSTAWVWWVALVGWIIGVLIAIFAFSFVMALVNNVGLRNELFKNARNSQNQYMMESSESGKIDTEQLLQQYGSEMTDEEKAQFKQMMEDTQSAMDQDNQAAQQEAQ